VVYPWRPRIHKPCPIPDGTIEVSFDVYDTQGNVNYAPNGVHHGMVISPQPTPTPTPTSTPTSQSSPVLADCTQPLITPWVALYQYSNFGGKELCFEGTGLINLSDYGFDKQTMSINIAANGTFFDQSNGQGNQLPFYYRDEQSDLGNWDNQISSFIVTS
jgi:hypothetical protein